MIQDVGSHSPEIELQDDAWAYEVDAAWGVNGQVHPEPCTVGFGQGLTHRVGDVTADELVGVLPSQFALSLSPEARATSSSHLHEGKFGFWRFWSGNTPLCMACISVLEVGLFLFTIIVNGGVESPDVNPIIGPTWQTLYLCGALRLDHGQAWRLISAIFLHAGVLHILPNVAMQWFLGGALESVWGSKLVAVLYFLSGLCGNLLSAILSSPKQISVGASGSVHGLMAASLLTTTSATDEANARGASSRYAQRALACALIASLGGGFASEAIDSWAHIGGAAFGLTMSAAKLASSKGTSCYKRVGYALFALTGFAGVGLCIYLLQCSSCFNPPGQIVLVKV